MAWLGRALRAAVPYLAYVYVTLVGLTTRVTVRGEERRRRLREQGRRFIYAFWHERQVFFTWTHRGDPSTVMVSRSADGDLIARTMELSRMRATRGSSTRGGLAAAREMLEAAGQGLDLGFTPDGPRGPRRQVKPGVLFLALKLGIPILPLTNALSRRLVFKRSWDQFQVPLPFGRAVLLYDEPFEVREGDDLEAKARELKERLDRLTAEAEAAVGRGAAR